MKNEFGSSSARQATLAVALAVVFASACRALNPPCAGDSDCLNGTVCDLATAVCVRAPVDGGVILAADGDAGSFSGSSDAGEVEPLPFIDNSEVIYTPEPVNQFQGRVIYRKFRGDASLPNPFEDVGTLEPERSTLRITNLRRVADEAIGWPVGDFTGLNLPNGPVLTDVQRGVNPMAYGSTAFQWFGTALGFQIASQYLNNASNEPRHPSNFGAAHLVHQWRNSTMVRPWLKGGLSTRLSFQMQLNLHHFENLNSGCVPYWLGIVELQDTSRPEHQLLTFKFFAWKLDVAYESMIGDTSTAAEHVNTIFAPDTEYATTEMRSARTTTGPLPPASEFRRYAAYIDGSHLIRVTQRYNQKLAQAGSARRISEDPRDYRINYFAAGPEMVIPDSQFQPNGMLAPGSPVCHFGSSVQGIRLAAQFEENVLGVVDGVTADGRVTGWAQDVDSPLEVAQVEVYVDDTRVLELTANRARTDDVNLGFKSPHGFEFSLPGFVRDGKLHTLRVMGVNSGRGKSSSLRGSGLTFKLSQ